MTLKNNEADKQSFAGIFFKWPIILLILVLLSITAVFLEGGTDSWGALYMRDYLQAEGFNVGLAAIAFNGAMVMGRLTGDQLKEVFGIQQFLFISIVCSLIGVIIVLFSKVVLFSIIGFVIAGLGVSSVIPICYTLASSIKKINPTLGITVITIAVYGNFMIAPPILGYTANIIGIQYVYLPIAILFVFSTLILVFKKKEL
jgi:MFS family permease